MTDGSDARTPLDDARAGVLGKLHVLRAADADARRVREGTNNTNLTPVVAAARVTEAWAAVLAAFARLEAVARLHEAAACRDAMVDMPVEAFALCAKRVIEAEAALAALPRERKEA